MDFLKLLKGNAITVIGKLVDNRCVIAEVIPENPISLVKHVFENGCYISEIRWWDRTPIFTKSKIGYGGTPDPRDPQKYYFAETDIYSTFGKGTTAEELFGYLEKIKEQYSEYDLYPAFDVYLK